MARCNCGGGQCNCSFEAGPGITIDGSGSTANPAIISAEPVTCDQVRPCFSAGDGAAYDPATGRFSARSSGDTGNNLTVGSDGGLFVPTGAATVTVGCGLAGDGSGSAPLTVKTGQWTHAIPVEQYGGTVACDANGMLRSEPRVLVCSLITTQPQVIAPDAYQIVRFPYVDEPADYADMHDEYQPDGYHVTNWAGDDRSGLIWPAMRGWGQLYASLQWDDESDATEYRSQFARDPLGLSTGLDTTATEHRSATPGGEFWTRSWALVTNVGTPLAVRIAHNATTPQNLTLAEFKLVITPMYE